jgi:hypothetical protein
MQTTRYFEAVRKRSDRVAIEEHWVEQIVRHPEHERIQADGRIRRWGRVAEAQSRWLRVVVLRDGITVHNAFFDRRFRP